MARKKRRRKNPTSASTKATPSLQENQNVNGSIPDPTGGYMNYDPNAAPAEQSITESRLNRDHKKDEEDPYEKIRMAEIWAEDEKTRRKQSSKTAVPENPYLYRDERIEDDQNHQGYENTSSVSSSGLSSIDYAREEEDRAAEIDRRNREAQEAELNNGRSPDAERSAEELGRQARSSLTDQSEQKLRDSVYGSSGYYNYTSTSGETEEKRPDFSPDTKQQGSGMVGSVESNSGSGPSYVSTSGNPEYQGQQSSHYAENPSHSYPNDDPYSRYTHGYQDSSRPAVDATTPHDAYNQAESSFAGSVADAQAAYEQMLRGYQEPHYSSGQAEYHTVDYQTANPSTVDFPDKSQPDSTVQSHHSGTDYTIPYNEPNYQSVPGNSSVVEPASFEQSPLEQAQKAYEETIQAEQTSNHNASYAEFDSTSQPSSIYQGGFESGRETQGVPSGPLADAQAEYEHMIHENQTSSSKAQDFYSGSDGYGSSQGVTNEPFHDHSYARPNDMSGQDERVEFDSALDTNSKTATGNGSAAEFNSAARQEGYDLRPEAEGNPESVSVSSSGSFPVEQNIYNEISDDRPFDHQRETPSFGHSGLEEAQRQYEQNMHSYDAPAMDHQNTGTIPSANGTFSSEYSTSANQTDQSHAKHSETSGQVSTQPTQPTNTSFSEDVVVWRKENKPLQNERNSIPSQNVSEVGQTDLIHRIEGEEKTYGQPSAYDSGETIVSETINRQGNYYDVPQNYHQAESTRSGQVEHAEFDSGISASQSENQQSGNIPVTSVADESFDSDFTSGSYMAGRGGLEAAQAEYDQMMRSRPDEISGNQSDLNQDTPSTTSNQAVHAEKVSVHDTFTETRETSNRHDAGSAPDHSDNEPVVVDKFEDASSEPVRFIERQSSSGSVGDSVYRGAMADDTASGSRDDSKEPIQSTGFVGAAGVTTDSFVSSSYAGQGGLQEAQAEYVRSVQGHDFGATESREPVSFASADQPVHNEQRHSDAELPAGNNSGRNRSLDTQKIEPYHFDYAESTSQQLLNQTPSVSSDVRETDPATGILENVVAEEAEFQKDMRTPVGEKTVYGFQRNQPSGAYGPQSNAGSAESNSAFPSGQENPEPDINYGAARQDSVFSTSITNKRETDGNSVFRHDADADFKPHDQADPFIDEHSNLGAAQRAYEAEMKTPVGSHTEPTIAFGVTSDSRISDEGQMTASAGAGKGMDSVSAGTRSAEVGHNTATDSVGDSFDRQIHDTVDSLDSRSGLGAAQRAYDEEMNSPVGVHPKTQDTNSLNQNSSFGESVKAQMGTVPTSEHKDPSQPFVVHSTLHEQDSHFGTTPAQDDLTKSAEHVRTERGSHFDESSEAAFIHPGGVLREDFQDDANPLDPRSGLGAAQKAYDEKMNSPVGVPEGHKEATGTAAFVGAAVAADAVSSQPEVKTATGVYREKSFLSGAKPSDSSVSHTDHKDLGESRSHLQPELEETGGLETDFSGGFRQTSIFGTEDQSVVDHSGLGEAQRAFEQEIRTPTGLGSEGHVKSDRPGRNTGDTAAQDIPTASKLGGTKPEDHAVSFEDKVKGSVSGRVAEETSILSDVRNEIRASKDEQTIGVENFQTNMTPDDRSMEGYMDVHGGLNAMQKAYEAELNSPVVLSKTKSDTSRDSAQDGTIIPEAEATVDAPEGKTIFSDIKSAGSIDPRMHDGIQSESSNHFRSNLENAGEMGADVAAGYHPGVILDEEEQSAVDHSGLAEAPRSFERDLRTPIGFETEEHSRPDDSETGTKDASDKSAPIGSKLAGTRLEDQTLSFKEKVKGSADNHPDNPHEDSSVSHVSSEVRAAMDEPASEIESMWNNRVPKGDSADDIVDDHSGLNAAQKAYEAELHSPVGLSSTKAEMQETPGELAQGVKGDHSDVSSIESRLSGDLKATTHEAPKNHLMDSSELEDPTGMTGESKTAITTEEKAAILDEVKAGQKSGQSYSISEEAEDLPIDEHSELGALQKAYEEKLRTPIGMQNKQDASSGSQSTNPSSDSTLTGVKAGADAKESPAGKGNAKSIPFAAGVAAAMAEEAVSSARTHTPSPLSDRKESGRPLQKGKDKGVEAGSIPVDVHDGLNMAQATFEADMATPIGKKGKGIPLNFNASTHDEVNKTSGKASMNKGEAPDSTLDKSKAGGPLNETDRQTETKKDTQGRTATSLFDLGKPKEKKLENVKGGQLNMWYSQGRRLRIVNAEKQIATSAGRAAAALFFMGAGEHAEGVRSITTAASLAYVTVGMSAINKARSLLNIPSKNALNMMLASMKNPITGRTFADVRSYQRFLNQQLAKLGAKGMPLMSGTQLQILAGRQINRLKIAKKLGKISARDFNALMAIYKQQKKIGRLTAFQRPKKFKLRARLTRLMFMLDRFMPRSEVTIGFERIKRYTRMAVKSVQVAATVTILAAKAARIVGKKSASIAAKGVLAGYKAAKKANIISQGTADKIEKTASKASKWAKEQQKRAQNVKRGFRNTREKLRDPFGIKSRLVRWKADAWAKVVNKVPFVGKIANVFSGIGNALNVVKVAVAKVFQWAALLLAGIILLIIILYIIVSGISAIFGAFDFSTADTDVKQVALEALQDCYEEDFSKILDVASNYNSATIDYEDIKDQDKYDEWKAEANAGDFIQSTNAAEILSMTLVYFDMDLTSKEDGTDENKTVSKNEVRNYVDGLYHGSHEILVDVTYEYESYDTGEVDEDGDAIMDVRTITHADITYRTNYFESLFECTARNSTPVTILGGFVGSVVDADTLYAALRDAGFTHEGACGIMGNMFQESSLKADIRSDLGYYGLCQWSTSAQKDLQSWCSANGYDYTTMTGQVAFLVYDLRENNSRLDNLLKTTNDTKRTASYFCHGYEKCVFGTDTYEYWDEYSIYSQGSRYYGSKYQHLNKRISYAQSYDAQYAAYEDDWSELSPEDGQAIAEYALSFVGKIAYSQGSSRLLPLETLVASNGSLGTDCSGFVHLVYKNFGITVPTYTGGNWDSSKLVSQSEMQVGDIILWSGHVAIYVGDGKVVNESTNHSDWTLDLKLSTVSGQTAYHGAILGVYRYY